MISETGSGPLTTASCRGFTLVEVMIAATLLGFIIMVLCSLYPSSVMAIRHAEHRIQASNLAQSVIELKRSGPFSDLYAPPDSTLVTGKDETVYEIYYSEPFLISGTDFDILKGIRVTVKWKEKEGQYSVSRETFICNIEH
jgi:prepilin-type N-terminal cleavage/methylation domain-containing protein